MHFYILETKQQFIGYFSEFQISTNSQNKISKFNITKNNHKYENSHMLCPPPGPKPIHNSSLQKCDVLLLNLNLSKCIPTKFASNQYRLENIRETREYNTIHDKHGLENTIQIRSMRPQCPIPFKHDMMRQHVKLENNIKRK